MEEEGDSSLSLEMQFYYRRVAMALLESDPDNALDSIEAVCSSLETLQGGDVPRLPDYFCRLIFMETRNHLKDLQILHNLMMAASALIRNNQGLSLASGLHQLLPAVVR